MAETYTLYLQTQNFHWNVKGPNFYSIHKLLEDQYSSYAEAIDELAELLRTTGELSPGTFEEFSELSSITMIKPTGDEKKILSTLIKQTQQLLASLRSLEDAADTENLLAIEDVAVQRISFHQKQLWILESSLAE